MKLNFRRGSAFASQKAKDYLKDIDPKDIQNITVIRHAAIGDFMNIRPFLIELREFFPNAKVTISLIRSSMYGYPEDLVDNIKIDPKTKKKTTFFQRYKQIKELPNTDIIFDLTDSSLSLLISVLSGAKLKVGYSYRDIRRMFYAVSTLRSDLVVEAQSVLHMLNILGAKTSRLLRYGLDEKYPKDVKKQIVYFAGASMDNKCWEKDKFKEVIDKLSDELKDYNHIILQGIGEHEKFLEIYEPLKSKKNVLLQETLSIDEVMQFLANSSCLVSNDTGVRNMAIATQTPTVGIFFMIPPFRYWPREEKHDVAYNVEYTSPSVEMVFDITKKLVNKLYEK